MKLFKIKFFDGVSWDWRTELVIGQDFSDAMGILLTTEGMYPQLYSEYSKIMFHNLREWDLAPGILELGVDIR